jgi:hypothetical protein
MRVFHYTCGHAAARIDAAGVLLPHPHPVLPPRVPPVLWLTDLETIDTAADRFAVGLTSTYSPCDRTERRYALELEAIPWRTFKREHGLSNLLGVVLLELGRAPERWYVHTEPVPVPGG